MKKGVIPYEQSLGLSYRSSEKALTNSYKFKSLIWPLQQSDLIYSVMECAATIYIPSIRNSHNMYDNQIYFNILYIRTIRTISLRLTPGTVRITY